MKKFITVRLNESGVFYKKIKKNSNILMSVILLLWLLIIYGCASLDSGNYKSRIRAVNKMTDQNLLFKVAMENMMYNDHQTKLVRKAAVRRVIDQNLLYKVAMKNHYASVGIAAVERLTDQNLLYKVAMKNHYASVRIAAVERLTDQNLLFKVAMENHYALVQITAVKRLTDQNKLIHIAENNSNWDVRKAAFNKLNKKSLTAIITEAKDPAVILAAKIRLGQTNWKKVFAMSSSSNNKLGNIIGAVALVKNPQPTSSDVVAACHNYIRRGDASRIPELIDLLTRFGDKSLAEDYMNCGNSRLKSTGEAWGRRHGYNVITGAGSHRVRWGR